MSDEETKISDCDDCGGSFEEPVALPEGEAGRCPRCHSASWGWPVKSKEGRTTKQDQRLVTNFPTGKVDLPGKSVAFKIPDAFLAGN